MKKTGEMLRLARESKGLSIHEVSVALKINSRILNSIEAGETQGLPAKTFLRGFVHSYASFVKADVSTVMASFSEEMGAPTPTPLTNMPTPSEVNASATAAAATPVPEPVKAPVVEKPVEKIERPQRSAPLTDPFTANKKSGKNFIWYAAGLILIFASLITKRLVDKYQRESVPADVAIVAPIPKPVEPEAPKPPASVADTSAPFSPRMMPIESLTTNSTETKLPEKPAETRPIEKLADKPTDHKPLEKPVEKPVEKPLPPVVVVPATPPPVVKAPTPPPPPPSAPAPKKEEPPKEIAKETSKPVETKPAETPAAPKGKKVSLLIEATDAITVEYKSATGETKTMTLAADQVVSINGTSGLELKLSNGGAANITVNGRDLGVAGDSGKPTVLKY